MDGSDKSKRYDPSALHPVVMPLLRIMFYSFTCSSAVFPPFTWWKGETTCNYSVALLDIRASVGRKKQERDRVTSVQTYTCHFVGWHWTAAVWSFSWWAPSLPYSHLRNRPPRHLEVPTEARATVARAPWLPWERKRQKRWMKTQESSQF